MDNDLRWPLPVFAMWSDDQREWVMEWIVGKQASGWQRRVTLCTDPACDSYLIRTSDGGGDICQSPTVERLREAIRWVAAAHPPGDSNG
jgi:hypothetical protein